MRAPHAYRGFTLIELIAVIVIIAILAAVSLPSVTAANPFADRGYADVVAANLRRARAVALTTGCDVQFTINGTGYSALQRGPGPNNHCAPAGVWATPVFSGPEPSQVVLGANRQFIFDGDDGRVAGAPFIIDIGARQLTVDVAGLVTGP
jgi:prepilin-type N-terminal cleavage/methylation domain-containing protein